MSLFKSRRTPDPTALPIMALVNAVFAIIKRNPMLVVRAGFFPFVLLWIIGLWKTPEVWGPTAWYGFRVIEWVLLIGLWTFYANQLMRFVQKGPMEGAAQFLPRFDLREGRFALASAIISLPFTVFAFWYDQPLFLAQPDLIVMGGMTAIDGMGELLYTSLFLGWLTQLMAFVLPALAINDARSMKDLFARSFDMLRRDFTRLFAASLLVALPVWLLIGMIRLVLHMPIFTQFAMADDASALAWNMIFYTLETLKIFLSGGMLALLWGLAYGRMKGIVQNAG